jgi:hypothetical protein
MENNIEIQIGNRKIVAFINDWEDELPKELYVCIVDENNNFVQDICMIREHYSYNADNRDFQIDCNSIDCRVWANENNEDFTDEFLIKLYE